MSTVALALTVAASGLLVSPADLAATQKTPAVVVLHVDSRPSDYEAAHIPGARLVLYSQFAVNGAEELGSELPPLEDLASVFAAVGVTGKSRVILYGPPLAAARAFFTLDYMGHPDVRILNGGLEAWKAAGYPVESGARADRGAPSSVPALHGKPKPEVVVTAEWISARMDSPQMALVDARPDAEFTGSDGGMNGMHPAGHLSGARQLVWTDLVSRAGQYLPDADLRAKLAAAGARAGVPVVSYCMVGMRASVIYFVARHLGFEARMYDGSIVDWGHRKLPVKKGR